MVRFILSSLFYWAAIVVALMVAIVCVTYSLTGVTPLSYTAVGVQVVTFAKTHMGFSFLAGVFFMLNLAAMHNRASGWQVLFATLVCAGIAMAAIAWPHLIAVMLLLIAACSLGAQGVTGLRRHVYS